MDILPEGYRWLRLDEEVPLKALWYDEDPEGTRFKLTSTQHRRLFIVSRLRLVMLHADRHKEWPSDAHGTCGIVVPSEEREK